MKTEIVNLRNSKYEVYIGRGSEFGNPFQIGKDMDREKVIKFYKEWFEFECKDPEFVQKLMELKGKKLGCFCKPLACHGDVIKNFLDNH